MTMPIKGLSEKRRIPRISKIHLGIKVSTKDGEKQYPKAVDFFVLPMRENSGDAFLAQAVRYRQAEAAQVSLTPVDRAALEATMNDARLKMEALFTPEGRQISAVYGPLPRELDVLFPSDKPEECFPQSYKSYNRGTGLFCKGDGVKAMRVGENGAMTEIDCAGPECPIYKDKKCSEMANLMVMIPRVSIGGCWQIDTGSVNSIIDVNSGMDQVKAHVGRLAMVPCKLRVVRRQVTAEGKKKSIFTLQVGISSWEDCRNFARELTALRREFREGLALPAPEQSKFEETHLIAADVQGDEPTVVLPSGERVKPATGEIVEAEFDPVAPAEGERTADDLLAEAVAGGEEDRFNDLAGGHGGTLSPETPAARPAKKPKADLWHHAGQPAPTAAPDAPQKAARAKKGAGKAPAAPAPEKPATAAPVAPQEAPKPPSGPASGVDF